MRILVFGMTENPGGVESFLMNYYRHIDRNHIQFDFLCNSYNPVAYEDDLIRLGGRTFHITARSDNYSRYKKELEEVFRAHAKEWDAIWVNVCSLANIDYLKMARKYGINKRIIHSHNSQNMDGKLRGLLHEWNKKKIGKIATDFWACSEDAAKWFYSGNTLQKAVVIHNAIDVDRLKYDEQKRTDVRSKYGWENKFVIGNIGRLHFQKNQAFCLEVFSEYVKENPESVMVFVGQGEDEEKLKQQAKDLHIEEKTCFTGVQKDIQGWLSSFDVFLFPSKFEGLGIAALEAQANGIPVLASKDVIPNEVKIIDNFKFVDLSLDKQHWAKEMVKLEKGTRIQCEKIKKSFVTAGYDIENEIKKIEKLLVKE